MGIASIINQSLISDPDTQLLLHFDGLDGATSTSDSSSYNHSITMNSNAELDTAQKKFGTASYLGTSSGDNIEVGSVSAFNVGSGDWTLDFQYRANSFSSGSDTHTWFWLEDDDNVRKLAIYKSSGTLTIELYDENDDYKTWTYSWSNSLNTWYHVAIVKNGNDLKLFVDGTQQDLTGDASDMVISQGTKLYVGSFYNGGNYLDGWMDEFRFSTTARWTSNFTAPSSAYTLGSADVSKFQSENLSNINKIIGISK